MTCPDDEVLIALADGALAESEARNMRSHAQSCTRCQATLAELSTIADDLRASVPGALGHGKTSETFADDILARLDDKRPDTNTASWWARAPRWSVMLAAAAILPLAITAAWRASQHDEWTARGNAISSSLADTKRTLIRFGRVTDSSFEPIAEGSKLDADAVLAAEVGNTADAQRFLLAFMVDSAGERHWIYPAYEPGTPPPSSIALPVTTAPRVLSSMVRFDHPAAGPANLVAIVLSRSESVDHVERAAIADLSRDRLAAHYENSLVVVTRVEILP